MKTVFQNLKLFLLIVILTAVFYQPVKSQGASFAFRDLQTGVIGSTHEWFRGGSDKLIWFDIYANGTKVFHLGNTGGNYYSWGAENGYNCVATQGGNYWNGCWLNDAPPVPDLVIRTEGSWYWDGGYSGRDFNNTWGSDKVGFPVPKSGSNLQAEVNCSSVKLTWDAAAADEYTSNAFRYEIYMDDAYKGSTTTLEYTLTPPGGSHSYKIKRRVSFSVNPKYAYSAFSTSVTATAMGGVSDLSASTDKCEEILLKWSYSGSAPDAFKVTRSSSLNGTYTEIGEAGSYSRTYSDYPPNPEQITTWYYKVQPTASTCSGSTSSSFSGSTYGHPAAPTNITATQSGSNIIVSWTKNSTNAANFNIKRTTKSTGLEKTFKVDGTTTTLTDDSAPICEDLTYEVDATNKCNTEGKTCATKATIKIYRDISGVVSSVEASKGYWGDKVHLEWVLSGITVSQVDKYNVSRRLAGTSDYTFLESVSGKTYFDDETSTGGKMYEYKIQAEHNCGGAAIFSGAVTDLGFRIPFATVSGQVLYEDNSATKNVRMLVEPTAGMINYSIALSGSSYISVPNSTMLNPSTAITLEAWVRMSSSQTGTATIISKISGTTGYQLSASSTQVIFTVNNTPLTITKTIDKDVFNQLTATYNGTNMIVYLNGAEIGRLARTGTISSNSSSLTIGSLLKGYVDHVRVWNVANDSLTCVQNYSRYLGQEESGMVMYLRMDENFGSKVYDFSRTGSDFNMNNGTIVSATWSDIVPISTQLGYCAYTDITGFYQVTSIGYSGAGQNFKLIPFLGPHQFRPGNKTLYLGEGSNVITDQNFTDISAYDVSGTVKYKDCSCYVADVMVMVDGAPVLVNGKLVYTDGNGYFKIKVPIGLHKISVQRTGHTFDNGGAFPSLVSLPTYPNYDFQDAVTGIEFIDNTTYAIVGRVVGGTIEGNKKPGLGLSKNNIGVANLKFKAEQGGGCIQTTITTNSITGEYRVSLPPLRYIITSDLGNSALVVSNRGLNFGTIDILDASVFSPLQSVSDTVTKEIKAVVTVNPPTRTATVIIDGGTPITNVRADIIANKATVSIEGSNYLINLTSLTNPTTATLTLRTDKKVSTTSYNLRRDYIFRSEPILTVTNPDGTAFAGEKKVTYKDPKTNNTFVVDLVSHPFLYDVFQTNGAYTAKIMLNEVYVNKDSGSDVVDNVPVNDAVITINNELSQEYPIQIGMSNGVSIYQFKGGVPNITSNEVFPNYSFTNLFQIIAQVGAKYAYWKPLTTGDKYYRGYVLGIRMVEGTDFVSQGPSVVDFILRDPPGSGSSATISKGTSYTVAESYSMNNAEGGTVSTKAGFGMDINQTFGFLGTGVSMTQTKSKYEAGLTIETMGSQTRADEKVTTTTFTETISTSDSPELAGTPSDIFVGKAQNILFGIGNELLAVPYSQVSDRNDVKYTSNNDIGYTLALVNSIAIKPSDITTHFIYTQNHIETSVIPNLIRLRNELLFKDPSYSLRFKNMNDPRFGLNNDDFLWGVSRRVNDPFLTNDNFVDSTKSDYSGPSYKWKPGSLPLSLRAGKTDMVRKYNEQIRIWKSTLARNEAEKLTATFEKNISFNAGANMDSESSVTTSTSNTEAWDVSFSGDIGLLINANIFGVDFENEIHFVAGFTQEESKTTTNETSTTIAYSLNDPDIGDYYSIDVKKPITFGGPVFYIQAGRSSCPYDAVEKPKYLYGNTFYYRLTEDVISMINTDLAPLNTTGSYLNTVTMAKVQATMITLKDRTFRSEVDFKKALFRDLFGFDYEKSKTSNYSVLFDAAYQVMKTDARYLPSIRELGDVKLNEGTIQREKPTINIVPAIADRIPTDKPAVFTLTLGNESDEEGMYAVKIIESTNPFGAVMQVDGTDIEGRIFIVPANGSLTKTLMVSKGSPDVNDYDSLMLMIYSTCDYELYQAGRNLTIADTVWCSVHFVPACTDLTLAQPNDMFTVNYFNKTENRNEYLYDAVIDDYDKNVTGLKKIQLQYKPTSSSQWVGLKTWWRNPADIPEGSTDLELPDNTIGFKWDVTQLPDQGYQLRAVSTCELSENYTLPLTGLMDRVNPTPFGSPQPADGILSAGDEVMIQFNEPIFAGGLTYSNFDLRGVLNGTSLRHGASIKLDGDESKYAIIPEGINFAGKSFSIETWFKRTARGIEQCLISQGNATTNGLWIGFTAADKLTFNMNGLAIVTDTDPLVSDIVPQWHHVVASFNVSTQTAQIIVDGNLKKTAMLNTDYKASGRVIVGKRSYNDPIPFTGNIHEMRIWYDARSLAKIYQNMNLILNGKERSLAGNWRFDEAFGTMARDYAASRNASLFGAEWKIDPSGDALSLNGSNAKLAVATTDIAFGPEENFTIEFWFKGENGANSCLFSNGKSDGTDTNPNGWSLTTDASGKMIVSSHGTSFKAVDTSYFDNKWHHFALVVNRLANITAFVDGNRQGEISAENWAEFGGPKLYLGALANIQSGSTTFSKYFSGAIDEFRVWGMARKQNQIQTTMNYMMEGIEPGLMLYLPFEKYTVDMGIYVKTSTYEDRTIGNHASVSSGGATFTLNSASIKLPRPLSKVNFQWVTNEDKILLDITDPDPLIENCILDVVVKDVKDLHENVMQSPATWSFFVNLNQMVWTEQEITLKKEVYKAQTFTAEIKNIGGRQQTYKLENLPSWLTASPSAGTIEPLKSRVVTFTVNQGVNLGNYNENIYLSTDLGFSEKLPINLYVYKPEPDWKVNPAAYQYSMSVIGQLTVNGVISTDKNDMIGVFSGDVCRGVVHLTYVEEYDRYLAYLDIYSNSEYGDSLTLKVWDSSEGKIITKVSPLFIFETNEVKGSPSSPVNIVAVEYYQGAIPVNAGWNWVSFNLNAPALNKLSALFNGIQIIDNDMVKGQIAFDIYSAQARMWSGSLTSSYGIVPGKMYMVKISTYDTINYEGPKADAKSPLSMKAGWNWLGYLPQVNLSPAEAFATFNPQNNDVVKSQYSFSLYDKNLGWIGSLNYLLPGYGYMYRATSAGSLIYPEKSLFKGTDIESSYQEVTTAIRNDWTGYPFNMSVVARIEDMDGKIIDRDLKLEAASSGINRGMAEPIMVAGKRLYFITIYGQAVSDSVKFVVSDGSGYNKESDRSIFFKADELVGNFDSPYIIRLKSEKILTGLSGKENLEPAVYPNPFSEKITINPGKIFNGKITIGIYDISGRSMLKEMIIINPDNRTYEVDGSSFSRGLYILKISDGKVNRQIKLIKE